MLRCAFFRLLGVTRCMRPRVLLRLFARLPAARVGGCGVSFRLHRTVLGLVPPRVVLGVRRLGKILFKRQIALVIAELHLFILPSPDIMVGKSPLLYSMINLEFRQIENAAHLSMCRVYAPRSFSIRCCAQPCRNEGNECKHSPCAQCR